MIRQRGGLRIALLLLGAGSVSVLTVFLLAQHRSFRIEELGGYVYWFVIAPAVGIALGLLSLFSLHRALSGWWLVGAGLAATAVLSTMAHTWALDHGQIGGEYLAAAAFEVKALSVDDLFRLLGDRNREVAGRAWLELQARAGNDPEIMWRALQLFREKDPGTYIDSYRTHDAVNALAARGDRRVIPILEEILRSQETSVVTPPGGKSRVVYHNRQLAKDLLARSFGTTVGVETEKPYTGEAVGQH